MPAYLSCPLCIKNTLSDVQELQKKIASVLCRSLHCPICSASLQGLPSLHFHLATHIPIKESGLQAISLPASPEHIPALEKLDIRDIRDGSNSPANKQSDNNSFSSAIVTAGSTKDEEASAQVKTIHYNCEFCGLVFSSEYFLTLHKDIMHSDVNESEVECKQCKCHFRNLESYRGHVKEVHSDRRYICDQCPKSFKIKGGLLVHMRMFHDQSSPSTCQVCKKSFTSKARKELHQRRYHAKGGSPTKKSPPLLSPTLKDRLHYDLGEAKNCSENIMQDSNPPSISSPSHPLLGLEPSPDVLTSVPLHNAKTPSALVQKSSKVDSQVQKKERLYQTVGRQFSCPPVIFRSYEGESETKYNFFIPRGKSQSDVTEQKSDKPVWKKEITKDVQISQTADYLIEKQQHYNCSPINVSSTVPSFNFGNTAYSVPKYSDFKLRDIGSLFPIPPLASSGSLSGQTLLSSRNNESLQELNSCAEEAVKSLQVPSNPVPQISDHLQMEPQNICPNLTNVSTLPGEVTKTGNGISLSNISPNVSNSATVKIPTDYTITLPPNVNMNISCLVNTINSPTNVINKMNSVDKQPHPSSVSKPNLSTMCNNQRTNLTSENEQGLQNKEEPLKTKISVKKTSFCHRGSESKQWECEECKKSFTTKYFLKKHKRLHTGETPYACEECGKTFTFQQSYHKHVFYHSDDKPHICPHCSRAFKEMSTLHNHVRIHTGEKPFVCTTCSKSFRQRVSYLVHQRIHTGILPYRCDICSRAFRYKVSLRSHKCEGRNTAEPSSNVSKHTGVEEGAPESVSANSPFIYSKRNNNSPSDQYPQPMGQERAPGQQGPGLQVGNLFGGLNELQEGSSSSLPPRSAELQERTLEFMESSGKGVNTVVPLLSEKSDCRRSVRPLHNHSRARTDPNRPLIHNNSIESALPRHSNNKILQKLDALKNFELHAQDVDADDRNCLHPDNKFDNVNLPNINMSDSFSPMNLDEDLDNDIFLKSLFS